MYRRDARHGARCQVPYSMYLARAALLDGLVGAEAFTEKLSFEMDAILGSVGVNETMSQLHRDVGDLAHRMKSGFVARAVRICLFPCGLVNGP